MSEADEILKLKQLLDENIISKEEFERKKQDLLNNNLKNNSYKATANISNKLNTKDSNVKRNFASRHPVVTVLIILFVFGAIGSIIRNSDFKFSSTESDKKNSKYITMSEYNQIQTGMTYKEVVDIIGSNGELSSEVNIGEEAYHTKIYTWYGSQYKYTGANANVTFQGGKVIGKAQVGLK